ncbi:MAG: sodium transporter, partial [Alphaproteobacteria bacterium]|nr:sodium transporter [Alphaproteobacteria bacterium]
SLIRPADDPYMPWTGLVFGAPILAFYYWCTNQVIVQRMLASRSVDDGQRGALLAGFLKVLTLFVIVLPGVAGRVFYPHLAHGDEIYLRMAFGLLPSGLLGLLLAAFLGALLSQLSATYNSAATLIAMDFVRRVRPEMDELTVVKWGRIATIGCMVISVAWVPQIARFPSLWQYFQAVLAYATPPVVVLFLAGILWPKANARGAFAAIVAGSGLGITFFAFAVFGAVQVQFLHVAFLVFVASLIALTLGSLCGEPAAAATDDRDVLNLATVIEYFRRDSRGVRGWAAALLAVTAMIVIWFR